MAAIPDIFNHLFDSYGDFTKEELKELCTRVKEMLFNVSELINMVYQEVDSLADITEIAKAPTLTNRSKLTAGKTWTNFKKEFFTAQKNLCCTGELTVGEGMNHTEIVNMVTGGVARAMQMNKAADETQEAYFQETSNISKEN
eukprot:12042122-Ditylum_brightwellii.AAC.1